MPKPITDLQDAGVQNGMSGDNPQGDAGENINMGSESLSLEDLKQKYDSLNQTYQTAQEKWELDMNQLKSSLQSNAAKEKNELSRQVQELKQRLDEAATKGMTEEQRRQYELTRMQERYTEMEQRYNQTQQQLQAQQTTRQIRDAFVARFGRYGLTADDIDMGSPEAATASGWSAMDKLLKNNTGASQTGQDAGKKVVNTFTESKVMGEGGKVPSTSQDPMLVLRKHVAAQRGVDVKDVSEHEVVTMMTQDQIDVDEIFSLEGISQ